MVAVAVVVPLLVMCAAVGSVLLRKRRGTVRRLRRERAAALAGARVDLAAALTPHLARELSRSLVEELVTFVSGSPARVQLAEQLPGDEQALRMWFNGGWQLVLRGMARSSRDGLLKAARSGLVVTGAELVEVFGNRIRLHWTNTDGAGQTFVQIAALQRPLASTGGARRGTAS
jgi:hypothetical protein